ncbi:MAG: serine/threonine protein kinase [Gemmatimonadota bacterium]|nr:serine/threonine protein kinase [Gemmatimonadota bacterium]
MSLDPENLLHRTVGSYTLEEFLGGGSFAWIFLGRHKDDSTQAAVKVLRPRYAGDRQFEARFQNEAKIASGFDHPNLVKILEVGQTEEISYFAMRFFADSLGSRIDNEGPLDEAELVRIATGVAQGLLFIHENGVVHRDIKSDNILLGEDGEVVIGDFGIAKAATGYSSATGQNMTIGTPHYVSPEQAQGRKLDGRSDLYALGITLYKGLTGNLPFTSTDWFELARMHVEEPPPPPSEYRPDVSKRLERIILRLMAKQPDERYESAAALLADLSEIRNAQRATTTFGLDAILGDMAQMPRKTPTWLVWTLGSAFLVAIAALVVVLVKQ